MADHPIPSVETPGNDLLNKLEEQKERHLQEAWPGPSQRLSMAPVSATPGFKDDEGEWSDYNSESESIRDNFETQGISQEELDLWSKKAPKDQKLRSALTSPGKSKRKHSDTEGHGDNDLAVRMLAGLVAADANRRGGDPRVAQLVNQQLSNAIVPRQKSNTDLPDTVGSGDNDFATQMLTELMADANKQRLDPKSSKEINHFVRRHIFCREQSLGQYTTSQRRNFERDVYDYARAMKLPKAQARQAKINARALCGEEAYDSDESKLDPEEADDSAALLTSQSSSRSKHQLDLPGLPCTENGNTRENGALGLEKLRKRRTSSASDQRGKRIKVNGHTSPRIHMQDHSRISVKPEVSLNFEAQNDNEVSLSRLDGSRNPDQLQTEIKVLDSQDKDKNDRKGKQDERSGRTNKVNLTSNSVGRTKIPEEIQEDYEDFLCKIDEERCRFGYIIDKDLRPSKEQRKRIGKLNGAIIAVRDFANAQLREAADDGALPYIYLDGILAGLRPITFGTVVAEQHSERVGMSFEQEWQANQVISELEKGRDYWSDVLLNLYKADKLRAVDLKGRNAGKRRTPVKGKEGQTEKAETDEKSIIHGSGFLRSDDSAGMTAADEGVSFQTSVNGELDDAKLRSRQMLHGAEYDGGPILSLRGGASNDMQEVEIDLDAHSMDTSFEAPGFEITSARSSLAALEAAAQRLTKAAETLRTSIGCSVTSTSTGHQASSAESSPLSSLPASPRSSPRTPTPVRFVVHEDVQASFSSPLSQDPATPSKRALDYPDSVQRGREKPETKGSAKRKRGATASVSGLTPLKRQSSSKTSPYFLPSPKPPREQVSCIPFPPLSSTSFGLVQESLASNPFHLLIAVIFLNKTRGAVAMPIFYTFITRFPDPSSLAAAEHSEVVTYFQNLGLQNQRAKKCIALAKAWLVHPPTKGKRWRRLHYPMLGDGKAIKGSDEPIADETEDPRIAWEIGHLPGIGAYGIDSWRIFCRDELRGLGTSALPKLVEADEDTKRKIAEEELTKEWASVLPTDKELRAYLRWRWLRLGWEWNPKTGEKKRAEEKTIKAAMDGGVICEGGKDSTLESRTTKREIRQMGSLYKAEHDEGSPPR
ncbi:MAG: hypothetical protein Q9218_005313 [Villophora microphyllina]